MSSAIEHTGRAALIAAACTCLGASCHLKAVGDTCDGGSSCADAEDPPRIYVTPPFGLGFDCIEVMCNQTQTLEISNRGTGTVNVTRITLTSDSSTDFTVEVP